MKRSLFIPVIIPLYLVCTAALPGPSGADDGSIHALGNGSMCIYEKGADIIAGYTGPYSTPAYFTVTQAGEPMTGIQSTRNRGTAIWNHTLIRGRDKAGVLIDFVDAEIPCFVRQVHAIRPLVFRIKFEKYVSVSNISSRVKEGNAVTGRLFIIPPGTAIYQTYVYPRILYNQLLVNGRAKINDGDGFLDVVCEQGESCIYLVGGPEYPDVMNHARQVMQDGPGSMMDRTGRYWAAFTARRTDFEKVIPPATPSRDQLLNAIDDVSVLLRSQQSREGAVLAGYPYPLGYVRDQYGVSRGMLRLGLIPEARAILNFYWQIWKKFGYIHNAQAVGLDGIFHIHENDDVESTGYLILQAFDLFNASRDTAFLVEISPMLDWAFESQKKHLVKGMLPFNGDETYVAGGLLPRSTLNDGSAEATMLFIEGGQKLLEWSAATGRWSPDRIAGNRSLLQETRNQFRNNFWREGVLWTNNPERARYADLPRFRHGVCEKRGPGCLMEKYQGIVWTERNENNRYLCAACITGEPFPTAEPKSYNLLSAALVPLYMGFHVLPQEDLRSAVTEIRDNFIKTGAMTSPEEMANQGSEIRTVGYDYGFLLSAMTALGMEEALRVYGKTLSVVDKEGSWSEYYINDIPSGTRCRPWESAINLEALINWAVTSQE